MDRSKRGNGPIGDWVKGAGFAIGLAKELRAHNNAKKPKDQSSIPQTLQTSTDGIDPEIDDRAPAGDGAIPFDQSLNLRPVLKIDDSTYIDRPVPTSALPLPVILPQRRPNNKSRGFVRAYAPDLGKYKGIDETTFLTFLKEFHKASQASGWFQVINIAALGAGFAPSLIALAVSISVQVASAAAAEAQSRYRTNTYLDRANNELFHPKNLHCMIMAFKPEAGEDAVLNLDTDSGSLSKVLGSFPHGRNSTSNANAGSGISTRKFRGSDGMTKGEWAIPQAAELVYSTQVQAGAASDTDENGLPIEKKESSWKSYGKFLSDYQDRRAQAKFAATYGPDSKLAVPGAADPGRFASKFSDPNVDIMNFLPTRDLHENSRDGGDQKRRLGANMGSRAGLIGNIKNMILKDNLLYLLIAEIPSEEQVRDILQ